MMKKTFYGIYLGIFLFLFSIFTVGEIYAKSSAPALIKKNIRSEEKWRGKIIFLKSEPKKWWYVDPVSKTRFPLFDMDDIVYVLEKVTVPFQDKALRKIPVANFELGPAQSNVMDETVPLESDADTLDTDHDGLSDYVESVFNTDFQKADSDEDGYGDKTEILAGYDPLSSNVRLPIDKKFTKQYNGRILVQSDVSALWYVNPRNGKRYLIKTESSLPLLAREVDSIIGKSELSNIQVFKKQSTVLSIKKEIVVKNNQEKSLPSDDSKYSQEKIILSEDCGKMIERSNSIEGKRLEQANAEECIFHHFKECTPATYSYVSYIDSDSPYTLQSSYFEILGFAGNTCRVKIRDVDTQFPGDYLVSKERIGKEMVCAFNTKEQSFKRIRATWAMENMCTGELYDILARENQWHANAACKLKVNYPPTANIGQSDFFEVVSKGDEQDIFWSSKDSSIVTLDASIGKKIPVKFLKAGETEIIVVYTAAGSECSSLLPVTVLEK